MKTCPDCGVTFEQTNKKSAKCLPCRRIADKAWRDKKKADGIPFAMTVMPKEYFREYEKRRPKTSEYLQRKADKERMRRENPDHKQRVIARMQTRNAIRKGILVRMPCEICGLSKVDAHHDDYSKPLDVRWLCREHHAEFHSNQGETK